MIAGEVQRSGEDVRAGDVERARSLGATNREIHGAVLIAAAFCMYNRYADAWRHGFYRTPRRTGSDPRMWPKMAIWAFPRTS